MRLSVYSVILGLGVFSLSSCVPVMFAGSSVSAVTVAAKEKGVSGALSDSQISTSLKVKIYQFDRDVHRLTGVFVENGEVLLTGGLKTQALIDKVEELAWSIDGVRNVLNEMSVSDDDSMGLKNGVHDSWITTQAKLGLVSIENVKSLNYRVKTVGGVIYLTGIAQDTDELHRVTEALRKIQGVKYVKSFVKMRQTARPKDTDAEDSMAEDEPAAEESVS